MTGAGLFGYPGCLPGACKRPGMFLYRYDIDLGYRPWVCPRCGSVWRAMESDWVLFDQGDGTGAELVSYDWRLKRVGWGVPLL